ncbi:diguanylate cyclase domain-containing protein [Erythrobacter sp. CCH5-A1]|jgi:GGDEF domain-containing protein|uniref:diguanylate cyclase domain-containing protein n=1 Tax=Erythrobacter sp. CCH5-A1 TaxID=1768792 RepID=UPI00082A297D|nr:diguanylate cyclase [Erythrobacter sp. CCH5-A1]
MTGIVVPLEVAAMLCAGCAAAGFWGSRVRAHRRLDPRSDAAPGPLAALHKPDIFAKAVDLATRRNAMRARSQAVLQGRIDQLDAPGAVWNGDTHAEVREHVAAVMRAGLRRGDRLAHGDGNAFTITLTGADERAAVRIADRLRRRLAQLRLPQLGGDAAVTASFGVAAERFGDGDDAIATRARRALDAAVASGTDHVVPASEIEEIMLLPAPAPSPSADSSTAASAA